MAGEGNGKEENVEGKIERGRITREKKIEAGVEGEKKEGKR